MRDLIITLSPPISHTRTRASHSSALSQAFSLILSNSLCRFPLLCLVGNVHGDAERLGIDLGSKGSSDHRGSFYPFAGISVHRYGPLQTGHRLENREDRSRRAHELDRSWRSLIVALEGAGTRKHDASHGNLGGRSLHLGFNLCTAIIITTLLSNVEISRTLKFL